MNYKTVGAKLGIRIMFLAAVFTMSHAVGGAAFAKSTYLASFNSTYGTSGTVLDTCYLCHPTGSGGRNAYGTAYGNANHSFSAIESVDSDGDGFSNIVEINARTFPGDASSKPAPSDTTPPTVTSTNPAGGATGVAVNGTVKATFSEAVKNVSATTFTLKAGTTAVAGAVTLNGTTATFAPSQSLAASTTYTATLTSGVTDLANNALVPYSWSFTTAAAADTTPPTVSSTNPASGATGVAVNAALTATFSEAVKNVTTGTFTLQAGATPVSGAVSVSGSTATFTPSAPLAFSTTYTATVTTGVTDLANNPLASNRTWSFTTGAAPDTTPPTVGSTNPASGAAGVAVNGAVTATFSEAVKNVTGATFTLKAGGAAVAGVVSVNGSTATFAPSQPLAASTTYTATLTTGVTDLANNALQSNYSWSFATAAAADTTPPAVSATNPVNGATAVPVSANVTATFSESVKNVTTATFTLRAGATTVSGTVALNGTTATFDPAQPLASSTTYTATVTTGVTDLANNALESNSSWSFTTGAAADTTPPTVSSTNPASGATGVAINGTVTATFSEAVKNVSASSFTLKAGTTAVAGAVTLTGTMATFAPSQPLASSTTYTATLTSGVKDLANNALVPHSWSFTTGAAADTSPPVVKSTSPAKDQTNVPVDAALTATFGEAVDAASLNTATFILEASSGAAVPGVVTAGGAAATFTPTGSLGNGVTYTATLTTGVKDRAGNALASAYSWSFTTVAASADSDGDGVEDAVDVYPNDNKKATPINPMGAGAITVDTSANAGTFLSMVSAMSDASPGMNQSGKPAGYDFRYGVVSYRVEHVAQGGTVRIAITFPEAIPAGCRVFKADSAGFHEYAQAQIGGSTVTLTLVDGGSGDADGGADGSILDPVGVAFPAAAQGAESAGGGCSVAGKGGGPADAAGSLGALLLLGVALGARRALRRPGRPA